MHIPSIGDKVKLKEDWTFTLHSEYRNDSLFKYAGLPVTPRWYEWMKDFPERYGPKPTPITYTIPAGSVLTIDRIYIRKGSPEFNSVTFILNGAKVDKRAVRFWAKLADVNKIR